MKKIKQKKKHLKNQQIVLGKKTEFPNSVNNLLEYNISNEKKVKIYGNKNYLIRWAECSKYYCKDCIKQITLLNINKSKEKNHLVQNIIYAAINVMKKIFQISILIQKK